MPGKQRLVEHVGDEAGTRQSFLSPGQRLADSLLSYNQVGDRSPPDALDTAGALTGGPTMLEEPRTRANLGLGAGLILQLVARFLLLPQEGTLALLGWPVALLGLALWIWGCWNYADSKGYPGYVGLLGIFSCFGLIILALLPDRS